MDTVELFYKKNGTIKKVPINTAILEIYYLKYRVPTDEELKKNSSTSTTDSIRRIISSDDTQIPLYDVFASNIYLIQKRNVYVRVVKHDYRFPDELIVEDIRHSYDKMNRRMKKNPDLEKDMVFVRTIRKAKLMLEFMEQFDQTVLHETYLKVFYRYAPEMGNATYTCMRKSFLPYKGHLKPYYTKDEVIKLGMNMGTIILPDKMSYIDYKDQLTPDDYRKICHEIQKNDISADILLQHQKYIIDNNMVGLIQYYTIQGSYFMNQYMRGFTKYEYRNDYLEDNIAKMWRLVLSAPAFDNDYILYRFVSTDEYLRHLNVGDVFIETGFTSTTRDPFYRNDLYKFGFVLLKIRIPRDTVGIGLCLETLSHFPAEEEIILPPMSHLKLVSRDDMCEYYHPDEDYASKIKTRYEFEWIENADIRFPPRTEYLEKTNLIDFLNLEKVRAMTLKERIDIMIAKYFDPMNRIKCQIGDKTFYVVAEWYDSTGPYEPMYSLKTSEGFSLYSLYEGYILFMIEIGEVDNYQQIKVNFYTKYSQLNRQEILGDDNFIKFISSIAYYFDIPNVIIYADYLSCDDLMVKKNGLSKNIARSHNRNNLKKLFESGQKDQSDVMIKKMFGGKKIGAKTFGGKLLNNKQRQFGDKITQTDKMSDRKKKLTKIESDDSVGLDATDDVVTDMGGSYCVDFYKYLKDNIKRYDNTTTLYVELQPYFSYHDLDTLKNVQPTDVLSKEDRDEIYQIYIKNYKPDVDRKRDNLGDFYIWMIENKCYLMDIMIKKMERLYRKENPFKRGMYILDAVSYLYNRKYINTYNRFIKMEISEEHQHLTLPKNDYRIRR